jgi:hypothetical protein
VNTALTQKNSAIDATITNAKMPATILLSISHLAYG